MRLSHNIFSYNRRNKKFQQTLHILPELIQIFFKLCAMLTRLSSILTFLRPLKQNSLKPKFCFISPITGSAVTFLKLYISLDLVNNLVFAPVIFVIIVI